MSDTRRLARINKIYGSQVHAYVEETHLGLTTVRLATNGARLSNLYTIGVLEPGDEAIVEYGTDGIPYVRPVTIPIVEEDEVVPAVKMSETYPADSPITVWRLSRTGAFQITTYPFGDVVFPFNKKIFDPCSLSDGIGVRIKESGIYLLHATVAFDSPTFLHDALFVRPHFEFVINYFERSGAAHIIKGRTRRVFGGDTGYITMMGLWMLYSGEQLKLRLNNQLVYVTTTCPVSSAKYPLFEGWKIAKVEGQGRVTT